MPVFHVITLRVRYCECDPMGVAHHSAYAPWLEMGRTELLREHSGIAYRDLEARGVLLAVVSLAIKFKKPARYDDMIEIHTTLKSVGQVKIEHEYEVKRGDEVLATASTTLACLGRDGRPQRIPQEIHHREHRDDQAGEESAAGRS